MQDAGRDPIRRAELIGSLVQSIAVLPEAIVRDVYIKECAQLLHVEDKLLVSEVAKRREKQAEQRAEQRERERRQAQARATATQEEETAPTDVPPPPAEEDVPAPAPVDNYQSFIPQEDKEGREFYRYEQLILQMVVRYGERVMCNVPDDEGHEVPVTVTEYIISDLQQDELAFHNPLHRRMLQEAAERIHTEGFCAEHYFLNHPDPAISRLSAELVSDRYQLSKYHYKNQHIVTDEERLYELVPLLMINFKYAIVSEELTHLMRALQDPAVLADNDRCTAVLTRYNDLRQVQSLMARRLGDRVVLKL